MTKKLVDQLREPPGGVFTAHELCRQAADELERLKTANAQMLEHGREMWADVERLRAERDEALEILAIALPAPRPWSTEGVEAKLRIYRNIAIDRRRSSDEPSAEHWAKVHHWGQDGLHYRWYQSCPCSRCSTHTAAIAREQQEHLARGETSWISTIDPP